MGQEAASRSVVELLIREAWDLHREGRYGAGHDAAARAVAAARKLGDLALEVRAADVEADNLRMLGDDAAALVRYTWILGVAEDPQRRQALGGADLREQFADAYMNWVSCGRYLSEIPLSKLLAVIDEGEAWLCRSGRPEWRAGLLHQRARVLDFQGKTEQAVGHAEEAVSLVRRHPSAPGYGLAVYLWSLGELLRKVGRTAEAEEVLREVVDDPASSQYDRMAAWERLARCALARDDPPAARCHAVSAVRLAEAMGDDALCSALQDLVPACRAADDLEAAAAAAERWLESARRVSPYRLYYALRDSADVALDRGDAVAARRHLDEAEPLAAARDWQADVETFAGEIASLRRRLAEVEAEAS